MTPIAALLRKEARALLPGWAGAMALVLSGVLSRDHMIDELAALGYIIGSFGLGALSFGHEYMHRTLPLLLTHPVPRYRIYLAKLSVLALALTTLAAASVFGVFGEARGEWPAPVERILAFVLLTSFFLAPALTMLCRSPIAGTVFSGGLAGVVGVAGGLIGILRFGIENTAAIDRFQTLFFWGVMPIVWLAGAIGGWRLFMRLQAIEGGGPEINPAAWFAALRRSRPAKEVRAAVRHPLRQLVAKELHIQQMAFVMTGVYLLVGAVVIVRQSLDPGASAFLLGPVTVMFGIGMAVLIGALASGEERQFGTLESQVLLPMAVSRQWAVKVTFVVALSLLLALAVPSAVFLLVDDPLLTWLPTVRELWAMIVLVVVFASSSLYVSSLSTSGVRALMFSVPFLFGGYLISLWAIRAVWWAVPWQPGIVRHALSAEARMLMSTLFAAGLVALLLRFGHTNHRTSDVSFARAVRQIPWIGAFVAIASFILEFTARGW